MADSPRAARRPRRQTESLPELIRLRDFLPYRLVVLADSISRSLSDLYEDKFGLTRQEWRILAALADNGPITSVDASRYTTLEPMAVSRASSLLEQKGYITREEAPSDRRIKIFRSTCEGTAVYRRIMPLAMDRERYLTQHLSHAERACLEQAVTKLMEQAQTLADNVDASVQVNRKKM